MTATTMLALGTAGAVWWSIGLAIWFLVVVPLVLYIAKGILRALSEIREYAADIREHGSGLAAHLEAVAALDTTRDLAHGIAEAVPPYAEAVTRLRGGRA